MSANLHAAPASRGRFVTGDRSWTTRRMHPRTIRAKQRSASFFLGRGSTRPHRCERGCEAGASGCTRTRASYHICTRARARAVISIKETGIKSLPSSYNLANSFSKNYTCSTVNFAPPRFTATAPWNDRVQRSPRSSFPWYASVTPVLLLLRVSVFLSFFSFSLSLCSYQPYRSSAGVRRYTLDLKHHTPHHT